MNHYSNHMLHLVALVTSLIGYLLLIPSTISLAMHNVYPLLHQTTPENQRGETRP